MCTTRPRCWFAHHHQPRDQRLSFRWPADCSHSHCESCAVRSLTTIQLAYLAVFDLNFRPTASRDRMRAQQLCSTLAVRSVLNGARELAHRTSEVFYADTQLIEDLSSAKRGPYRRECAAGLRWPHGAGKPATGRFRQRDLPDQSQTHFAARSAGLSVRQRITTSAGPGDHRDAGRERAATWCASAAKPDVPGMIILSAGFREVGARRQPDRGRA